MATQPDGRMKMLFSPVGLFIAAAAATASGALVAGVASAPEAFARQAPELSALFALTLLLQSCSIRVSTRGSISVSSIPLLAAAFAIGPGPAMVIAIAAAVVQWIRRRGLLHRAVFDAANFSLAAGLAAVTFGLLTGGGAIDGTDIVAAFLAGGAYCLVNTGLLCMAMSLAEGAAPLAIWRQRFRWATPHYLAAGPLACTSLLVYEQIGLVGLAALALPYAAVVMGHRRLAVAT
jgi:hypothetical protein